MSAGLVARDTSLSLVGGTFLLCALIGIGCAVTQSGATADDITRARTATDRGATVFASACAQCHGARGEGVGRLPAILGPGALPELPRDSAGSSDPSLGDPQRLMIQQQTRPAGAPWRDPFRNAQDLFNFTSTHLSKDHAAKHSVGDYWAVVSFMLAAQGAALPPGGVGPANASSIQIPRP